MRKPWLALGRVGYILSRPIVNLWLLLAGPRTRVVVISQGNILLVKDWVGDGRWKLPGGGLHLKELPLTGAIRELREETGLSLDPKLLTQLGQLQIKWLKLICFKVELTNQPLTKPGFPEVIEASWLPIKDLSQNGLCDEETRQILSRWPVGGF